MDQKDLEGALKSYLEGLAITKKLIQQSSDNFGWQWDLSDWYADIGKVLRGRGDLVRALKNYRDSNSIREMLKRGIPATPAGRALLGGFIGKQGRVVEGRATIERKGVGNGGKRA